MIGRVFAGVVVGAAVIGAAALVLMRSPAEPPKVVRPEPPSLPPPVLKGRSTAGTNTARPDGKSIAVGKPEPRDSGAGADPPAGNASPAPAPKLATLRFDSDVPGAKVFLDRELVGVMPLTASGVKPGPHRLNISVPGYEPVSENIEVEPGPRDMVFKFREVRLNAKIAVIHKHRLGSCTGTLVATQRGLRYDTSDKNDAFTVALPDIEMLQVDYLENRLRIAVRGKRYDFNDPAGNADPLFVFHQDVEKARTRLKNGDPPAPD
jgi:hypothetical protein